MASTLAQERFWTDKARFDTAERQYYESLSRENSRHFRNDNNNNNNHHAAEVEPEISMQTNATAKPNKPKKPKKTKAKLANEVPVAAQQAPTAIEQRVEPDAPAADPKPKKLKKKNKNKEKATVVDKENAAVVSHINSDYTSSAREATPSPLHLSAASNLRDKSSTNNNNNNNKNVGNSYKPKGTPANSQCTLVSEIAKAREHIKNSLEKMDGIANLAASPVSSDVLDRINAVEKENADLRKMVENLKNICLESQKRIAALEQQVSGKAATAAPATAKKAAATAEPEDDDGVDLFASDSDDENDEASRIREERLAAYAAKKSKKPALIAKSSLVLDVKPWDDETDLKLMEAEIRKITADGLLWGASKFVPVAFGIQKLSISCVVEDEKISIDWLTEEIEKFEDFVQSVDVAAFNKI